MKNKLALNVIDFATNYLQDWQAKLDRSSYETLKELCTDIYGDETWKAISFFGGIDPLAFFFREKGKSAEFANYILEFYEDYPDG